MTFLIDNWTLLLVAFVSGGMLVWPMVRKGAGGGGSISAAEAVRLINREKAVLVDVGEDKEYSAGHANGAKHLPLAKIEAADGQKLLPGNKTLPVVVLCPTGARAARAAAALRKAGYDKAVALQGGTAAWREANLPIEKAAST